MTYIPEPQPQHSDFEISAFYYPGTEQMAEWDQVEQTLPGIKPLLGWYDESNPEVIDWQIKWAVEHGISSICLDWYWNKGDQRLDHWIKSFYQARFRKYLKWYMMWANHNEIGAHSAEDQIRVTQFWIEHYFRTPEYYTIDGRPVVVVWDFKNLDRDFRMEAKANGEDLAEGEGVKRALELSNQEMRKAGLPDIYFVSMCLAGNYDVERINAAHEAGFEDFMVYNYVSQGFRMAPESAKPQDTQLNFNFDCIVTGTPKWWEQTSGKDVKHPLVPILPTGWNSQPRSFENALVIYDRTPEKYRKLCRACRDFCEKNNRKWILIAPLNEWQEGSYIEPNEEFGFEMYNAVRDAFCTEPAGGFPPDLLPKDAGRGPYDFPPMERPAKTSWDFSSDVQGWYRQPFGTAYLRIIDGALHFFRSGGDHAALRTRLQPFPAKDFSKFKVMMKVTPPPANGTETDKVEVVRLYFGTTDRPLFSKELCICREGAVSVPAIMDSEWHEYTLDLAVNPLWNGMINELWFDPPQEHSTYVDIRWMKLEP